MALLSTWLNLEPSYLAQLCIYTGATLREEIMHPTSNILEIMNFWRKIHILHLLRSFDIYAKDTKFINGTSYTDTCTQRHTQTDTDTFLTFYTFCLIWHTCQRYKFYIWHTRDLRMHRHSDMHTHRHMHMYRDIDTQIQIHKDTCMFVYTHTHTDMHVGNLRKLLVQIHF